MSSGRAEVDIAGESSVFIGVDVGGSKVRLMTSDSLHGDPELDIEVPTQPNVVVTQICDLVGRHLAGREGIVAIGVPGVVNPITQSISNLPYAGGLEGVALRQSFEKAFGRRPLIENDVNLAAFGIHRELIEPVETLLVVAGGTGVGMGMLVHGRLLRGMHGSAGEVGDLRFASSRLEQALNSRTLILAKAAAGDSPTAVKQSLLDAEAGDHAALELIGNYADALVGLLETLEITFDPERIELTGGVVNSHAVMQAVQDRIADSTLNPRVRWAQRGSAAPAWGALEFARWGSLDEDSSEPDADRGGIQ